MIPFCFCLGKVDIFAFHFNPNTDYDTCRPTYEDNRAQTSHFLTMGETNAALLTLRTTDVLRDSHLFIK